MAAIKRIKAERERDLVFIEEQYVRGKSIRTIAGELSAQRPYSVTHTTIKRDINTILSRWRETIAGEIALLKAGEIAKINAREIEAWEAWEKSKQPDEKSPVERPGDPRFLTAMEACVDQRLRIIGLEAPKKIAPVTPDGENPYLATTDDELKALAAKVLASAVVEKAEAANE